MKSQTKVKLIILLAITLLLSLLVVSGFQIVNIHQANKTIAEQQNQIQQLQQQLDNLNNQPGADHETITGENK